MALFSKNSGSPADRTAERRAAQEQVFLREVDDALREDDTIAMFRRYGRPLAAAIVLALAGLGGWMLWTNHQDQVAGEHGEAMTVALDQTEAGRFDDAKAGLDRVVATGGPGYGAAARLVEGGIAVDRRKPDDAAKIFDAVAADPGAPQIYRDLATVRSVAARFDTMAPQVVIDRLKPLTVPGNAWFGSAGELTVMALLKAGRTADAIALLVEMAKDKDVPDSLRRRARQMAMQMGVDPGDAAPTTTVLAQ